MVSFFRWSLLVFLLSSCTSLVYQPDKYFHTHPDQFQTKFEVFNFKSLDGTKLSAWKLLSKKPPAKNLVVFFHGNAQNLTAHFVNLVWMMEHDYDVIIFDYRGYGLSEGKPEPKGVSEDGLAFLNYGYEQFKKLGYKRFIVYTQSLGGAVALKSLEDFKHLDDISLLVLDSTFLSPRLVARDKTNRVLQYLISNEFTADPRLSHLKNVPVLSIHSKEDPVVSYQLGLEVFNLVPGSKKDMWSIETPGHGNVYYVEKLKYQTMFIDYVNQLK